MSEAYIEEIFSSIQGEGPWIGQRHVFVRFLGCDLKCRYCDTPAAQFIRADSKEPGPCRVQKTAGSFDYELIPNPVSGSDLTALSSRLIIRGQARPYLCLTGGEPLLQKGFLAEWLPHVKRRFTIYLETCGIHYEAMKDLRDLVDVVSMDFKLPSATGLRSYRDEHRMFLKAAVGKQIYVKAVVTKDTVTDDVVTAAKIIAEVEKNTLLVIQPASGPLAPEPRMLLDFQDAALGIIPDVRIILQAHKALNLP